MVLVAIQPGVIALSRQHLVHLRNQRKAMQSAINQHPCQPIQLHLAGEYGRIHIESVTGLSLGQAAVGKLILNAPK